MVVDEVLGQWIALAGARDAQLEERTWPPSRCSASSISGSRRRCGSSKRCPAGSGIDADDVMAGVYAALVLFAAGWFNLY